MDPIVARKSRGEMFRKWIDVVFLLICLAFVFSALFAHFILQKLSFQNMVLGVLFFGMGVIVQIISLTTKHKGWLLDMKILTKGQTITIAVCSLIFSVGSLWLSLVNNIYLFKVILAIGFLFFGIGGILLLKRNLGSGKREIGGHHT